MRSLLVLFALCLVACDREPEQEATRPSPAEIENLIAGKGLVSKPRAVVPMPKDQAEVDRMILAGFTPHDTHLHAPGVNECPLSKGAEGVM
jgi:hypothetical protein